MRHKTIITAAPTPRHAALAERLRDPDQPAPNRPQTVARSLPCAHEGNVLEVCHTCSGAASESRHVRECDLYGRCTRGVVSNRVQSCQKCPFYALELPEPPVPTVPLERKYPPVGKRHLLYHLLPVKGNGVWRSGVDQLRLRWNLFTGRKVVSVATGGPVTERIDRAERVPGRVRLLPVEPVEAVREYLPKDCEVVEVRNDPNGWELASWNGLWDSLFRDSSDDDAVFYSHAKGVTRRPLSPCQKWAGVMYSINLDHYSIVEGLLSSKKLCGGLVKHGHFGGVLGTSRWHYSGNFWWGRVRHVREALLRTPVPPNAWAPEAWTGMAFPVSDAGDIFTPKVGINHLYSPVELERVLVEYDEWLSLNPPEPVSTNCSTRGNRP